MSECKVCGDRAQPDTGYCNWCWVNKPAPVSSHCHEFRPHARLALGEFWRCACGKMEVRPAQGPARGLAVLRDASRVETNYCAGQTGPHGHFWALPAEAA